MSYPEKNLNAGEHIALDLRPHWWYFSHHILAGIPLFALAAVTADMGAWRFTVVRYLFEALFIAWGVWLALKFLSWWFTNFMVSDQRVVYRTGVLARHGVEIPLARIANINFDQGIWTRAIGAGTLDIESAGKEGKTRFTDVKHPDEVQREVYHQMGVAEGLSAERIGRAAASGMTPSVQGNRSVADEISALVALRDAGELTADEFAQQKSRLLNGD